MAAMSPLLIEAIVARPSAIASTLARSMTTPCSNPMQFLPRPAAFRVLLAQNTPGSSCRPGFYVILARPTARITCLHLEDETTTDACAVVARSHLRLEWLESLEYLAS